jgi:ribosome-associated heat shock protein Hsp15
MDPAGASMKLDQWLWAARIFSSVGKASRACKSGQVQIVGRGPAAKPTAKIRVGQTIRAVDGGGKHRTLIVAALREERLGAPAARVLYREEQQEQQEPQPAVAAAAAAAAADAAPAEDELVPQPQPEPERDEHVDRRQRRQRQEQSSGQLQRRAIGAAGGTAVVYEVGELLEYSDWHSWYRAVVVALPPHVIEVAPVIAVGWEDLRRPGSERGGGGGTSGDRDQAPVLWRRRDTLSGTAVVGEAVERYLGWGGTTGREEWAACTLAALEPEPAVVPVGSDAARVMVPLSDVPELLRKLGGGGAAGRRGRKAKRGGKGGAPGAGVGGWAELDAVLSGSFDDDEGPAGGGGGAVGLGLLGWGGVQLCAGQPLGQFVRKAHRPQPVGVGAGAAVVDAAFSSALPDEPCQLAATTQDGAVWLVDAGGARVLPALAPRLGGHDAVCLLGFAGGTLLALTSCGELLAAATPANAAPPSPAADRHRRPRSLQSGRALDRNGVPTYPPGWPPRTGKGEGYAGRVGDRLRVPDDGVSILMRATRAGTRYASPDNTYDPATVAANGGYPRDGTVAAAKPKLESAPEPSVPRFQWYKRFPGCEPDSEDGLREDGAVRAVGAGDADGRLPPLSDFACTGAGDILSVSVDGELWLLPHDGGRPGHGWHPRAAQRFPAISRLGVLQLAAGREHALVLVADGVVFGIGADHCGQLGLGDHTAEYGRRYVAPTPMLPVGQAVDEVAAGDYHSLLRAGHAVYSCGLNENGQLGLGHDAWTAEPTPCVTRKVASALRQFNAVQEPPRGYTRDTLIETVPTRVTLPDRAVAVCAGGAFSQVLGRRQPRRRCHLDAPFYTSLVIIYT